jgi:hypothetical protein
LDLEFSTDHTNHFGICPYFPLSRNGFLMRRKLVGALALAAVVGAGTVGGFLASAAHPEAAHAASVVGGPITRAEVMARAWDWYNQRANITYNSNGSYPDLAGKTYRTDCSGYVSMALHLNSAPNTDGLATSTYSTLLASSPSSSTDLRPGDYLDDTSDGHVVLFDAWESDHVHFSYYSFGHTPLAYATHASFSDSTLSGWTTSHYKAYRYINIQEGTPSADYSGDGVPDVVGVQAGTSDLIMYTTAGNNTVKNPVTIGSNWSGYDQITRVGDFDGDGVADIVARNTTDHDLYLFHGRGATTPLAGVDISNNWSTVDQLSGPGDFDGDGHNDIIGRNTATSQLVLYRGNGTGGFIGSTVIGASGWNSLSLIMSPGDFNNDGHPDVLARNTSNQLMLYPGTGTGFGSATVSGTGWSAFSKLVAGGDVDGDGNNDLIAFDGSSVKLYHGSGAGGFTGTAATIGTGWTGYTTIF